MGQFFILIENLKFLTINIIMDKIKKLKKIPFGLLLGCIMIDSGIIESIYYNGFDSSIIHNIKNSFNKININYMPNGTIITLHKNLKTDNSQFEYISKNLGYPYSIDKKTNESIYIELSVKYKNIIYDLLTINCKKIGNKEEKFITKISDFINKLDCDILLIVNSHKYFSIDKINYIINNNKKMNKEHKEHIKWLFLKYDYDYKINKSYIKNVLKLIEMEMKGFFYKIDKKIKNKIL
jgi:hypothetical protein